LEERHYDLLEELESQEFNQTLAPWSSKAFFIFPPYKSKHCQFLPSKDITKMSPYLLWRNNRRLWTKQTLTTSIITVKATCPCVLYTFLPI